MKIPIKNTYIKKTLIVIKNLHKNLQPQINLIISYHKIGIYLKKYNIIK